MGLCVAPFSFFYIDLHSQLMVIEVAVGGSLLLLLLALGFGWCWCKRNWCRDIVKMDVNDQYGVYSDPEREYTAEDKVEMTDNRAEYQQSTYDYIE